MKISIITVTRNCRENVQGCLESVAAQTHADCEHVVIDGASTDGTLELLEARRGQLAVLLSEPDRGLYDALNKGLTHVSGDIVGLLHADDVYADAEVLSRVAAAFADPAVEAVYGDLIYVTRDAPERIIRYWRAGAFQPRLLARGWMPPHPTLYLRRSVYERCGGFDTRYHIASDYDLVLRVLTQLSGRIHYLPQVLVCMRLGGISNGSLRKIMRKSWEDYQALRRNRVGGLGVLAWKNLSKVPQFFRRKREDTDWHPETTVTSYLDVVAASKDTAKLVRVGSDHASLSTE